MIKAWSISITQIVMMIIKIRDGIDCYQKIFDEIKTKQKGKSTREMKGAIKNRQKVCFFGKIKIKWMDIHRIKLHKLEIRCKHSQCLYRQQLYIEQNQKTEKTQLLCQLGLQQELTSIQAFVMLSGQILSLLKFGLASKDTSDLYLEIIFAFILLQQLQKFWDNFKIKNLIHQCEHLSTLYQVLRNGK